MLVITEREINGKVKGRLRRMPLDGIREWTMVKDYEEIRKKC